MNVMTLAEVIEIALWQKIQDHFAEVIGVTIRTIDAEINAYTTPSNPTRFCAEIVGSSPQGIIKCAKCLPPSLENLHLKEKWNDGYQCFSGLYNFAIPISVPRNQIIAYILVGPVILGQRQKAEYYRQDAQELGIDLDRYFDGLREIKSFSFSSIQAVLELLKDVASYIAQRGYQKIKLEKIISLPKVNKMVYKFYIDKLLDALLDVSFHTIGAEFGSIMLVDKKRGELYIKIGRGIKKEIIKHTRLKIGEGFAGLAAQEKRFLFLDDKISDERIKNRLSRPEIKSAVVAPIRVKDEVLGVMNLGTFQPANKFNPENMATLNQLVKLVDVTLQDFTPN